MVGASGSLGASKLRKVAKPEWSIFPVGLGWRRFLDFCFGFVGLEVTGFLPVVAASVCIRRFDFCLLALAITCGEPATE